MDEPRFRQYLAELGPLNASRGQELPAPLRALRQRLLRYFASTGEAPGAGTFRQWAASAGVDAGEALAGLVRADLAEADPDTGIILGAYPFTVARRGYQVAIAGGPAVQAYCAIDALGIPAMLGKDADITSRDPHSGAEIRVRVRAGQATATPAGTVASVPAQDAVTGMDQPAADAACPAVSFFASAPNAESYQRARGLALEILTIPQAASFGAAAFSAVLDPDDA